jgi:ankyrin repeat protein
VYLAVDAGHGEVVRILVKTGGADVDARRLPLQWTPLFTAAYEGKVAMTKVLLGLKANVTLVHEVSLSVLHIPNLVRLSEQTSVRITSARSSS